MKKAIALLLLVSLIAAAFTVIGNIDFIVPPNWPKPVYDFTRNPLTTNKIQLGRALFYDPIL